MKQLKKTILTLVALIAVTTGAWAETGENIFQYCYDCQRSPAYPKTTASASLSGFANPYVGYKGIGYGMDNTPAGPWKLEYVGLWSTTNQYGIEDFRVSNYQSTYNCTDVPVFRLYQWNATANEYQHAAYGVVCAYANVSNAVEHTAFFDAEHGWGCVLTNSSHSSSMNITFDEDLTTGLTTLIAAATPSAATGPEVDWDKAEKTGTFTMPGGNVELEPEYYPQAALTAAPTAINDVPATTDGAIVNAGTVANIDGTTTAQGTVMYYAVQSETAPTAPDYDATGWTDKVPTATDFDEGNVYVWYYIKGAEPASGTDRTDANTCSDSEITALGTTGYVTLAAPPTYAITLKEGTEESDKWDISPAKATKGTTITATYSGERKVKSVKAVKKGGAVDPKAVPLTIEAITAGIISVSSPKEGMQYSLNGGVKTTMSTTTTIDVAVGDKVQFYGNGTSITQYDGTQFNNSTAEVKVYGNIMSLVDEENFATATTLTADGFVFMNFFAGYEKLIDASGLLLPATKLSKNCYSYMFGGCSSLTAAPALPATELADGCYSSMFYGCSSLTAAYVKAANISEGSSPTDGMFSSCSATGAVLHTTTASQSSWNNLGANWSVVDDWND